MAKKFSELKVGDSLWIWWLQELYEYGIQNIVPIREFMVIDGEEKEVEPSGEFIVILKCGAYRIFLDYINEDAFVWGTDGWHEYKIIGTSEEAVKECLKTTLENDKETLEVKTRAWLAAFSKEE